MGNPSSHLFNLVDMALDRDDKILKKITKLPSKKQFGDLAYSWLKERFPNAEDIMNRETRCELIGAPIICGMLYLDTGE